MTDEKTQTKRKRSPSYPYINLGQAIGLIGKFYEAERGRGAPVGVALEHMGYSSNSGSGTRILSTLLQYGLLDEEGTRSEKHVFLSDLGMDILEAPDEVTRSSAIQQAALNPEIHLELWERWDLKNERLPSDSSIRYILLKDFGFQKNAVDSFITEFKETYLFAKLDKSSSQTSRLTIEERSVNENPAAISRQDKEVSSVVEQIPPGMKVHTIQLIGQPMARLILPHPLSERNLNHLINWLNLMGPALTVPEDEYLNTSSDDNDDDLPF